MPIRETIVLSDLYFTAGIPTAILLIWVGGEWKKVRWLRVAAVLLLALWAIVVPSANVVTGWFAPNHEYQTAVKDLLENLILDLSADCEGTRGAVEAANLKYYPTYKDARSFNELFRALKVERPSISAEHFETAVPGATDTNTGP